MAESSNSFCPRGVFETAVLCACTPSKEWEIVSERLRPKLPHASAGGRVAAAENALLSAFGRGIVCETPSDTTRPDLSASSTSSLSASLSWVLATDVPGTRRGFWTWRGADNWFTIGTVKAILGPTNTRVIKFCKTCHQETPHQIRRCGEAAVRICACCLARTLAAKPPGK